MTDFPAAGFDNATRIVSILTVVLLTSIALTMALFGMPLVGVVLIALLYACVIGIAWSMSPRGYRVEGAELVVVRNRWKPVRALITGRSQMPEPWRMGIRVGGSGGLFGYYGRFRRKDVGVYRAYLTSRDHDKVVALDTSLGIVTISPADPAGLLARVGA